MSFVLVRHFTADPLVVLMPAMSSDGMSFDVGARLSFSSSLCTIRYIGPVHGTQGTWLGVEWDDPARGKHSGTHSGKEYFQCR